MHLIRIPNAKDYKRAITTLLELPRGEYLGLPDYQMVVTDEHVKALEGAGVAFTYLSKTAPNGTSPTAVQS